LGLGLASAGEEEEEEEEGEDVPGTKEEITKGVGAMGYIEG
jgi:hypothetical protein